MKQKVDFLSNWVTTPDGFSSPERPTLPLDITWSDDDFPSQHDWLLKLQTKYHLLLPPFQPSLNVNSATAACLNSAKGCLGIGLKKLDPSDAFFGTIFLHLDQCQWIRIGLINMDWIMIAWGKENLCPLLLQSICKNCFCFCVKDLKVVERDMIHEILFRPCGQKLWMKGSCLTPSKKKEAPEV